METIKNPLKTLPNDLIRHIISFLSYSEVRELSKINKNLNSTLNQYGFIAKIKERKVGLSKKLDFQMETSLYIKSKNHSVSNNIQNAVISKSLDLLIMTINNQKSQLSIWQLSNFAFKQNLIEYENEEAGQNEMERRVLICVKMIFIENQSLLIVVYHTGVIYGYKLEVKRNHMGYDKDVDRIDRSDSLSLEIRLNFKRKVDAGMIRSIHYLQSLEQFITVETTSSNKENIEITFLKLWNSSTGKHFKTKIYKDKAICHFNTMSSKYKGKSLVFLGCIDGNIYYRDYERVFFNQDSDVMVFYDSLKGPSQVICTDMFKNNTKEKLILVSYSNGDVYLWDIYMKTVVNQIKFSSQLQKLIVFQYERKEDKEDNEKEYCYIGYYKSNKVIIGNCINKDKNILIDFSTGPVPISLLFEYPNLLLEDKNDVNVNVNKPNTIISTTSNITFLMIKDKDAYKLTYSIKDNSILQSSITSHKSAIKNIIYDYKNEIIITSDTDSKVKIWKINKNNEIQLIISQEFKSNPVKMEKIIVLKGIYDVILSINSTKSMNIIDFSNKINEKQSYLQVKSRYDEEVNDKIVNILDLEDGYSFIIGKMNGEICLFSYNFRFELKKIKTYFHSLTEIDVKKLRITCLDKSILSNSKYYCVLSGSSNGSICVYDLKSSSCLGILSSSIKEHESPVVSLFLYTPNDLNKQTLTLTLTLHKQDKDLEEVFQETYILYIIEKGILIIKDLTNRLIKSYQNDRDFTFIEKLNRKYFYYTEKDMNRLYLCHLDMVQLSLRIAKQVILCYDVYKARYVSNGKGIISFGYDSIEGEPLTGNAIEYIQFLKEDEGEIKENTKKMSSRRDDLLFDDMNDYDDNNDDDKNRKKKKKEKKEIQVDDDDDNDDDNEDKRIIFGIDNDDSSYSSNSSNE